MVASGFLGVIHRQIGLDQDRLAGEMLDACAEHRDAERGCDSLALAAEQRRVVTDRGND